MCARLAQRLKINIKKIFHYAIPYALWASSVRFFFPKKPVNFSLWGKQCSFPKLHLFPILDHCVRHLYSSMLKILVWKKIVWAKRPYPNNKLQLFEPQFMLENVLWHSMLLPISYFLPINLVLHVILMTVRAKISKKCKINVYCLLLRLYLILYCTFFYIINTLYTGWRLED